MAQLVRGMPLAGEESGSWNQKQKVCVLKKLKQKSWFQNWEKIDTLSKQDLSLKISALEMENKDNAEKMQVEILGKTEEIANLERECEKHAEQNQAMLIAAERKLVEARKQYDVMLESRQSCRRNGRDVTRRLQSAKKNQGCTCCAFKRKFCFSMAWKLVQLKIKLFVILFQHKWAFLLLVLAVMVTRFQQKQDRKELNLRADHNEELKRAQLQAEDELREEDRQRALLQLQWQAKYTKTYTENTYTQGRASILGRHRSSSSCYKLFVVRNHTLYGLPRSRIHMWNLSISIYQNIKKRDSGIGRRTQDALVGPENEEKESPFPGVTQTPVSKLLKKVENTNTGSVMSISKHNKKVTHHEYEVETTNGRTVTKRRKMKSTVLFEDPRKHKKVRTPRANTPRSLVKGTKGSHPNASNIGDLLSEGSLNPHVDDPYAFD
ncbi:synaptonemal complex protein 1-like [Durio zibethinus]|uniref:Synaptonemal complex protein 1-like n=1 Tax=Durio zibethinus TaxID=66656 RepID=A0A6P6AM32_DURZI|nr:synaptonemal complex protein 1-like [Durio zibethinus]